MILMHVKVWEPLLSVIWVVIITFTLKSFSHKWSHCFFFLTVVFVGLLKNTVHPNTPIWGFCTGFIAYYLCICMETPFYGSGDLLGLFNKVWSLFCPIKDILPCHYFKGVRVSIVFSHRYQCCSPLLPQVIKDWLLTKLKEICVPL